MGFSVFGERRQGNWVDNDDLSQTASPYTNRGYTGHEHIEVLNFIHMNGRVYDPQIGRFLSADPYIQAPTMMQSFNRYSYVMNNPLRYMDPSGYWGISIGGIKVGDCEICKDDSSKGGISIDTGLSKHEITAKDGKLTTKQEVLGVGTEVSLGEDGTFDQSIYVHDLSGKSYSLHQSITINNGIRLKNYYQAGDYTYDITNLSASEESIVKATIKAASISAGLWCGANGGGAAGAGACAGAVDGFFSAAYNGASLDEALEYSAKKAAWGAAKGYAAGELANGLAADPGATDAEKFISFGGEFDIMGKTFGYQDAISGGSDFGMSKLSDDQVIGEVPGNGGRY